MEIGRINKSYGEHQALLSSPGQMSSVFGIDAVSVGGSIDSKLISPSDLKELFKPSSNLRVLWSGKWDNTDKYSKKGVMVGSNGSIYSGNRGAIRKLNHSDGSVLWETDYGRQASGSLIGSALSWARHRRYADSAAHAAG